MLLTWTNPSGIAGALLKAYPDEDRLSLGPDDLKRLILSLPEFSDTQTPPDETRLRSILWTWMRLADPADETGRD